VVNSPLDPPWFLTTGYWTEYPEDIELYGISFNTTVGTWSLGGEVSYRPNLPLQIDDVEVLFAALTPLNPLIPAPVNRYKSQLGQFAPGEYIRGWHEHESWQAQATLTKLFGPNNPFRANQIAFVTEVGFISTDDGTFGGSPDGLVGDDGGVEIKCRNAKHHMACLLGIEDIADRLQVQGYLWLTSRAWWDVVAYNPELPIKIVRTHQDPTVQVAIEKALDFFFADFQKAEEALAKRGDVIDEDDTLILELVESVKAGAPNG